jgi:DNA-3-methyladenine glycosylase I
LTGDAQESHTVSVRCEWAASDPLMVAYHDEEWGTPSRDDRHLFELLVLEGAQAGLSWITILRKRENYRRLFAGFDAAAVARFDERDVERLLADAGIVRNRAKIGSVVTNAQRFLDVQEERGSFAAHVWEFVGGSPIVNARRSLGELPAETAESRALSKDLKRRGFRFVGPTICYAFMQAAGLVNDHVVDCFRYGELTGRTST